MNVLAIDQVQTTASYVSGQFSGNGLPKGKSVLPKKGSEWVRCAAMKNIRIQTIVSCCSTEPCKFRAGTLGKVSQVTKSAIRPELYPILGLYSYVSCLHCLPPLLMLVRVYHVWNSGMVQKFSVTSTK